MGFEVYVHFLGVTAEQGIPRAAVREMFPIVDEKSERDYWLVRYDERNTCNIGVTALTSGAEELKGFYVERPCSDLSLWEGLFAVLQMGTIVIFWPGGAPVVANNTDPAIVPKEMTESIGQPKTVSSGEELRRLVRES